MKIVFTVTTQPHYDQRMIRICAHLAQAGNDVTLIGVGDERHLRASMTKTTPSALKQRNYRVILLPLRCKKGPGFYAEYNSKLLFKLLFIKADVVCSIDLDTIIPVFLVSKLRRFARVHDAHEYFSQMKEVVTRPRVYRFWHWIERTFLPRFPNGYTVSDSIAADFYKHYGLNYRVVRNVPLRQEMPHEKYPLPAGCCDKFLLYQGSVNEGRGFEYLIPALDGISLPLVVAGTGNFFHKARKLAREHGVEHKVFFLGQISPHELLELTGRATIGLNLVEPVGLSQIYSLANKFFDYIHAGLPQITMNFPEYRKVNQTYEIALLLPELTVDAIVDAIGTLLNNEPLYQKLQQNCLAAREKLNWQQEAKILTDFYANLKSKT